MFKRLKSLVLVAAIGSIAMNACAATRIYWIGNSVTDALKYGTWKETAEAAGQSITWGRHMIPGAPMGWIWDHSDGGISEEPFGLYPNALGNYTWDFVSVQPYDWLLDSDTETGGKFLNLAITKSPDVTLLVFGHYPRTSNIDRAGNYQDFWDRPYTGGWDGTNETRDYYEQLVRALRQAHPDKKPVLLVPIGDVYYELDKLMRAGQFPGKNDIVGAAYADGIHQNDFGNYIVGCTYYSVMYQKNPTDFSGSSYGVPDNQATIIQQTVWSKVSTNALSGGSDSPVATMRTPTASAPARSTAALRSYTIDGRVMHTTVNAGVGRSVAVRSNATGFSQVFITNQAR